MPDPTCTPVVVTSRSILVYYVPLHQDSHEITVHFSVPTGFQVGRGVTMSKLVSLGKVKRVVNIGIEGKNPAGKWAPVATVEVARGEEPEWIPAPNTQNPTILPTRLTLKVGRKLLRSREFELGSTELRVASIAIDDKKPVYVATGFTVVAISSAADARRIHPQKLIPNDRIPTFKIGKVETVDLSPLVKIQPKKKSLKAGM